MFGFEGKTRSQHIASIAGRIPQKKKTPPPKKMLTFTHLMPRIHYLLLLCGAFCSSSAVSFAAEAGEDTLSSYVFLQKFPLQNTSNLIFHTEVLVCPRVGFGNNEQDYLDRILKNLHDFVEIPIDWWSNQKVNCREFGYGGAVCSERCCGSPHTSAETRYPLNERRAVIGNADTSQKSLFLYGTSGPLSGVDAYHKLCPPDADHPACWSNWAGTDYNPLTNNCNTFTSTLLHCVFGLSEKKPNLGPSDMITVTCDKCPAAELSFLAEEPQHNIPTDRMMEVS